MDERSGGLIAGALLNHSRRKQARIVSPSPPKISIFLTRLHLLVGSGVKASSAGIVVTSL